MVVEVLCVQAPMDRSSMRKARQQGSAGSSSMQPRCAPADGVRDAGTGFGCAETQHAAGSPCMVREERPCCWCLCVSSYVTMCQHCMLLHIAAHRLALGFAPSLAAVPMPQSHLCAPVS